MPLAVWVLLGYTDILSFMYQHPKPMYFRAWEYVINEGKDSFYVPFKPHAYYRGAMTGDMLNYVQFTPKPNEIRKQEFSVDEYGFRNPTGMLQKPIFAVMTGTSFVGGAQETQSNLITEMLNNQYKIPTYNYATLPLQFLWEDRRFITNKPRYIFVVGNESEIMQDGWIEALRDTSDLRNIPSYDSYGQWSKINNSPKRTYSYLAQETKRYSLVRYVLKTTKLYFLNSILPRSIIFAISSAENIQYDANRDILFSDKAVFDPSLNVVNKLRIKQTIKTLSAARDILAKRDIKLLVIPVPSKSHMHSKDFMYLPNDQQALLELENEMTKNQIEFVDIYYPMKSFLKKYPNELLYYPDDGHWNTNTNRIIAKEVYEKITKDFSITSSSK